MSKLIRRLTATAAVAAALLPAAAGAAPVTLTFEGAGTGELTTFYDTGVNDYNIVFSSARTAASDGSAPTPPTVLFKACASGPCASPLELAAADGFNTSVSFSHTGLAEMFVDILDENGVSLLGSAVSITGGSGWVSETINFVGTAHFLVIDGQDRGFSIDDIVLDLATPNNDVPEPATLALMALALVGVASTSRRRQA